MLQRSAGPVSRGAGHDVAQCAPSTDAHAELQPIDCEKGILPVSLRRYWESIFFVEWGRLKSQPIVQQREDPAETTVVSHRVVCAKRASIQSS